MLFPYSTPTPPDALEITRLSGSGDPEAYILVRFLWGLGWVWDGERNGDVGGMR